MAAGRADRMLWVALAVVCFFLFAPVGAVLGLVYLLTIRPKLAHVQAARPPAAVPPAV